MKIGLCTLVCVSVHVRTLVNLLDHKELTNETVYHATDIEINCCAQFVFVHMMMPFASEYVNRFGNKPFTISAASRQHL